MKRIFILKCGSFFTKKGKFGSFFLNTPLISKTTVNTVVTITMATITSKPFYRWHDYRAWDCRLHTTLHYTVVFKSFYFIVQITSPVQCRAVVVWLWLVCRLLWGLAAAGFPDIASEGTISKVCPFKLAARNWSWVKHMEYLETWREVEVEIILAKLTKTIINIIKMSLELNLHFEI